MDKDTYLGDGLYASFDGFQIRLYATDGVSVSNEVFMEPSVYDALLRFVDGLKEKASGQGN